MDTDVYSAIVKAYTNATEQNEMTKSQMKQAIEITAKEQGVTELEVITEAQSGAALINDEKALEILCDLKWDYIA